jgi:hypothetical protein
VLEGVVRGYASKYIGVSDVCRADAAKVLPGGRLWLILPRMAASTSCVGLGRLAAVADCLSALLYPWIKIGWVSSWLANSLTVRFPLECAECYLGLEPRRALLSLAFHRSPFSWATRIVWLVSSFRARYRRAVGPFGHSQK